MPVWQTGGIVLFFVGKRLAAIFCLEYMGIQIIVCINYSMHIGIVINSPTI